MNFLDILLAIPMGYLIFKGWRRGIIFEISSLLGIILGCYLAIRCSKIVADLLPFQGESTILVAFFVLFVGVLLLSRILGRAVEGAVRLVHAGWMNKALGALVGLGEALCILAVLLNYMILIDNHQDLITQKTREESVLFKPVHTVGNKMTYKLKAYVDQAKDEKLNLHNS